jgi:hypothetical protein
LSIKSKIVNINIAYTKLVTFGIGFAITFVIGTAIEMADHGQMAITHQVNQQNTDGK